MHSTKERETTVERRKTSEEEESGGRRDRGMTDKMKENKRMQGKEALEANRCLQGHINHTFPVWQIDRSLQISPSTPPDWA